MTQPDDVVARAKARLVEHERAREIRLRQRAKPVICELCRRDQHRLCTRPCVCGDGHKSQVEQALTDDWTMP